MKTTLLVFYLCIVGLISCTKDASEETNISNVALSSMATSSDDLVLIRTTRSKENTDWKIKMNAVASKAYSEGKNFPVNSMIIKEKYNASGKISGYDIMYKAPADKNSSNGWLWSQVSADGHVIYNASKKGASCQNCHETQSTK